MKKKIIRLVGWAMGLSLGLAGIGASIGLAFNSPSLTTVNAEDPQTHTWNLTTASYASADSNVAQWTSSYACMTLERYGANWGANTHLGGGGNVYTTMGKGLRVTFTPSPFAPIVSVTVAVRNAAQVGGWTGGTKDNCSVSYSGTTITVTPTDGTSKFSIIFSDYTDVLSVSVNYTPIPFGTLERITVDASRANSLYQLDQEFSPSGLSITAWGDSGLSVSFDYDTSGVSITGGDTSSYGRKNVTVSFTFEEVTKSTTYSIIVAKTEMFTILSTDELENPNAIAGINAGFSTTYSDGNEIPSGNSQTFTLTPSENSIYWNGLVLIMKSNGEAGAYKISYACGGETVYLAGSEDEGAPVDLPDFYVGMMISSSLDVLVDRPLAITVACTEGTIFVERYLLFYSDGPMTYLEQVDSLANLWDGQRIVFSDGSSKIADAWTTGNYISTGTPSFTDGDICLQESENCAVYTVSRVKVEGTVYYTFFDGTRYLKDSGSIGNNDLTAVETLEDACYFTVSITDGVATIRSKANAATPYLGFDPSSNVFSCYNSGQTNPKIYAIDDYSAETVANHFEENRLLLSSYTSEEGYCKDNEHGYYAKAKSVWQAMSEDEKNALSSEGRDRLVAWASANGDLLNGDLDLVSSANSVNGREKGISSFDGNAALVLVIGSLGIAAAGGIFLFSHGHREE